MIVVNPCLWKMLISSFCVILTNVAVICRLKRKEISNIWERANCMIVCVEDGFRKIFIFPFSIFSCLILKIRNISKTKLAHGKDSSQGYQNIRKH